MGKPNEWQVAQTDSSDSLVQFNVATGQIIFLCNDSTEWDAETFRALFLELERKGMYDG